MISFRIGSIRCAIHPLFLALCVLAFWAGGQVLPALLALLLHESGHLLMAKCCKLRVDSIELTPLGGLMEIRDLDRAPHYQRFLVALAGPLMSALSVACASYFYRIGALPFEMASGFTRCSLVLLLINLLPVLPLDGGRMLHAILSTFFNEKSVEKTLVFGAKILAAALCGVSLARAIQGRYELLPFLAGVYLFYAASMEGRRSMAWYMSRLIGRRLTLNQSAILKTEQLAVGEKMPVSSLLARISPQKYHIVHVLSADGMRVVGTLDEDKICSALMNNEQQTFGDLIH